MHSSIISACQEVYNGGLTGAWAAISNKSVQDAVWGCVSHLFQNSSPLNALNSRALICSGIFFMIAHPILHSFNFKGNLWELQAISNNIDGACVTGAVIADLTGEKSAGQFYIICRMFQMLLVKGSHQKRHKVIGYPLLQQVDATVTVISGILFALQGKLDIFGAYRVAQSFPVLVGIKDYFSKKKT